MEALSRDWLIEKQSYPGAERKHRCLSSIPTLKVLPFKDKRLYDSFESNGSLCEPQSAGLSQVLKASLEALSKSTH